MIEFDMEKVVSTVEKNTSDIQDLTVQVTRIATIVENQERRHFDDVATMKEALAGINKINDNLPRIFSLEKDFSSIEKSLAELKADIRVNKHDINTIMNAQQGMTLLDRSLSNLTVRTDDNSKRIGELEVLRNKFDGGAAVAVTGSRIFWAVFSLGTLGGVCGVAYFLLKVSHGQ